MKKLRITEDTIKMMLNPLQKDKPKQEEILTVMDDLKVGDAAYVRDGMVYKAGKKGVLKNQ